MTAARPATSIAPSWVLHDRRINTASRDSWVVSRLIGRSVRGRRDSERGLSVLASRVQIGKNEPNIRARGEMRMSVKANGIGLLLKDTDKHALQNECTRIYLMRT